MLNLQIKNLKIKRFVIFLKNLCNIIFIHTGQGFQNMHQLLLNVFSPPSFSGGATEKGFVKTSSNNLKNWIAPKLTLKPFA